MKRTFPRTFDSLPQLFEFAERFLADAAVPGEHHYAVKFAIEEMFTNMVKYSPDSPSEIHLELERDGTELRVTLKDFGVEPFDPTARPEPSIDRPLDERQPGGLGIHLVRKLMDRVEYHHADRTSTITLVKTLG